MTFRRVQTNADRQTIEKLGNIIWHEHYTPIIGEAQVNYMLEKYQSKEAVKTQIEEGTAYYLVEDKSVPIGYLSFYIQGDSLFISKIYVLKNQRGKGFGKKAMTFIENEAKKKARHLLRLTVNKFNTNSILAYEKMGFYKKESVVMDIGHGFVMDDYVMEKRR